MSPRCTLPDESVGRVSTRRGHAETRWRVETRPTLAAYLKDGGTLEKAAEMANHASTRTTRFYDRRRDEMSLDEVERIRL